MGQAVQSNVVRVFMFMLLAFGLTACSTLKTITDFEEPKVKVVSLKALPAEGMQQRFAIGLTITNPNQVPLNIDGMSYSLKLAGFDLLSGVSNNIPEIKAFSETPVEIEASVSLVAGLRFLASLAKNPDKPLTYELAAKLSTASLWGLPIKVSESGTIDLSR